MPGSRRPPWAKRLMFLGVLVLLLVVILLFVHLLYMGTAHTDDAGCGTCVTVLVVGLAALVGIAGGTDRRYAPLLFSRMFLQPVAASASGRHPPSRSVVLRL